MTLASLLDHKTSKLSVYTPLRCRYAEYAEIPFDFLHKCHMFMRNLLAADLGAPVNISKRCLCRLPMFVAGKLDLMGVSGLTEADF